MHFVVAFQDNATAGGLDILHHQRHLSLILDTDHHRELLPLQNGIVMAHRVLDFHGGVLHLTGAANQRQERQKQKKDSFHYLK